MSKLTEGMREGDLEDLVLPMITIDEYESKLDDNAIVFGFYVNDRDAAEDLNRFLQKSPVEMLDTEVSPAPDQHGYYIVFVELVNDQRITENIATILDEASPLVGNEEWQMRLRGLKGVKPFNVDTLTKRFASLRAEVANATDEGESKVMEFLRPSDLTSMVREGETITLAGRAGTIRAEFVAFGDMTEVVEGARLDEAAVSLDFKNVSKTNKIASILGEHWVVTQVGDVTILQRAESNDAILLRGADLG